MMKLAFSTLGCPEWSWKDIYATAKDLKFDGIEVRGVENELYIPKAYPFVPKHIDDTLNDLKNSNLSIPMLTSGICVGWEDFDDENTAQEYIDLAVKLNTKYIRIMVSDKPYPEQVMIDKAVKRYNDMCEYGKDKGVTPLIETNGVLADSLVMNDFMGMVQSENKGVLWDVHHPYRYFGETPQITYNNIGQYVKYVHVKDSIESDNKIIYRMMGYGDVPIFDTIKLLKDKGYEGFVSLEWVKRWCPELEGAGIVFAHYVSFMKYLIESLNSR